MIATAPRDKVATASRTGIEARRVVSFLGLTRGMMICSVFANSLVTSIEHKRHTKKSHVWSSLLDAIPVLHRRISMVDLEA